VPCAQALQPAALLPLRGLAPARAAPRGQDLSWLTIMDLRRARRADLRVLGFRSADVH
jgi:hypothetical protein